MVLYYIILIILSSIYSKFLGEKFSFSVNYDVDCIVRLVCSFRTVSSGLRFVDGIARKSPLRRGGSVIICLEISSEFISKEKDPKPL